MGVPMGRDSSLDHRSSELQVCGLPIFLSVMLNVVARVQLPKIRDAILLRHVRVLRVLGLSAVWCTGHNTSVQHIRAGRRLCANHTCARHAGDVLRLPIPRPFDTLRSPCPAVLR